jgi:Zn-dependent M28 family amino/carboxypeptidase
MRAAANAWLAQADAGRLRSFVSALPGPRSRIHAPKAMARTDRLLSDAWREAGWRVERQELHFRGVRAWLDFRIDGEPRYRRHRYRRLDGANLIATAPGREPEAIVLVAHHDTVRDSPGADDNGAALALLAELSRLLAGRRRRRTVILAAPDFEEIGLVGSARLVPWLQQRHPVRAVIVFDPIGFMDPRPGSQVVPDGIGAIYAGQVARLAARKNRGDTVVGIYRRSSLSVARAFARCVAATLGEERVVLLRDPVDLPLIGRFAMLVPVARNFSRSDHVPFWRAGLPAIQVTNTANFRNPHYHRASDVASTLDYETLRRVLAATALATERLADAPTKREASRRS